MSTITVTKEQAHKLVYIFIARHMREDPLSVMFMGDDIPIHGIECVEVRDYKQEGDELSIDAIVTTCHLALELKIAITRMKFKIHEHGLIAETEFTWGLQRLRSDDLSWIWLDKLNEIQLPPWIETPSGRNDNE